MLRAVAETENQRRRLAKEQADRIRFANETLLLEILGVLDNLDRCLAHAGQDADVKEVRKGVELTLAQFRQAVRNAGAEPIPAEIGALFDPKLHDAVLRDDKANLPERTLVSVLQTGFRYHERVLRPARVVVSSGKGYRPPSVETERGASRQDASAGSERGGLGLGAQNMVGCSDSVAGNVVQDEPVQQR